MSLKAGAKLKLLFVSRKKNLKNFETFFRFHFLISLSISQGTFRVLRGANVERFFKTCKLFLNFFSQESLPVWFLLPASISVNVFAVAGAKVAPFSSCARLFSMFFRSFFYFFPNLLITVSLQSKVF
ncbi:hypothetical protein ACQ9BO_17025 [Flavobacterium sp. P21]|uniref:hypothetical protein n=1 Tax=Flavobacterium sp. P21 TaxID=3423948 RepID=UPI003D675068